MYKSKISSTHVRIVSFDMIKLVENKQILRINTRYPSLYNSKLGLGRVWLPSKIFSRAKLKILEWEEINVGMYSLCIKDDINTLGESGRK